MDPALKAVLALIAIGSMLAAALVWRRRHPSTGSTLVLAGAALLTIVALAHICEAFHLLPAFGWGQPHSVGHYIDLVAAILGVTALLAGLVVSYMRKPR